MKPDEFIKEVRKSVVDENISIYRDLFENTEVSQASDVYWNQALVFFKNLSMKEKETLFEIMRQVSIDTISNLFAILDGVSLLEGQDKDFNLRLDNMQGNLQDIWLEIEELSKNQV